MKAGRELDALIAEKVMGATVFNTGPEGRPSKGAPYPAVIFGKDQTVMCVLHDDGEGATIMRIPHYSTQIADARLVVERLTEGGEWNYNFGIYRNKYGYWANFMVGLEPNHLADTAPLAICLAALKAVGDG